MDSRRGTLSAGLAVCAPLPSLMIGIVAMRQLGVSTSAWSINIAATVFGLLIWSVGRRLPPLRRRATRACLAGASIATILLPFASEGMLGVHRWVSMGGLRLHASAIAAPLIILCVAAAASHGISSALAIGTTAAIILALQPDAAQTTSFAAACAVVLVHSRRTQPRQALLSVALLLAVAVASFVRRDPLPPVAHVEGIFGVVASRGAGSAAMATVALLLLPVPFFAAWLRHRRATALALGVYVAMTLFAPAWGTFPVPIMGYGASPILGYFLALAVGLGGPSRLEEPSREPSSPARRLQMFTTFGSDRLL
jgi:cell division protein FtsW (lipid II flippase)